MDGILILAKPAGPTSHDMVALVRRLTSTKRVGHGGTLDPFAGGVLPIFLGRATRIVEYHLGDDKRYRATVCFGASSTTDDLEGELTPVDGPPLQPDAVEAALEAFRGPIAQVPPAYSAVKVAGRRAYAMARAGEAPVLAARQVTIKRLEIAEWDGSDPDRPIAILDVECTAGTYIRAIARDLGARLGSAAYLGALTRTASGPFRLEDAVSLDRFRDAVSAGPDAVRALLRPIDSGLDRFPVVPLSTDEVAAILRGQFVRPTGWHAANAAAAAEGAEDPGGAGAPGGAPGGAAPGDRPARDAESPDDAGAATASARSDAPGSSDPHASREPTGPRGLHYRLVDSSGTLIAIAEVRGGRLAPEKVLQDRDVRDGAADRRPTPAASTHDARGHARGAVPRDRRPAPTHVIDGLAGLSAADGPVFVVVGVFDGLHRGHLYLLEQLRAEAARRSARGVVVTFDAHPDEILVGKAPPILVDHAERLVRLGEAGVEHTVVATFDNALRSTPFEEFVGMISRQAGLSGFLMTPDAAFGHDRLGTPESLAALGEIQGFDVVVVPPFEIDARQVRSSEIRQRIAEGELAAAAALLGRPVAFVGERRDWTDRDPGSGPETTAELDFRLPVALPPAGEYAVEIEPAWQPGVQRGPVVRGMAVLGQPGEPVRLTTAATLPGAPRLRISVRAPVPVSEPANENARLPGSDIPATIRRS